MLCTILLLIIGFAAGFVFAVSRQSSEFRLARSLAMNASASAVFPHVNNLHNWNAWSPWAKLDPNSKTEFEGPSEGVGAAMRWEGNGKIGKGAMTIIESRPNELIKLRLDFLKPMVATNIAEFNFQPQDNQTFVTWTMSGKNNLVGKTIGLVMNCEKMIGGQFDNGLASIKAIVERTP